jgi:hypothetical protein
MRTFSLFLASARDTAVALRHRQAKLLALRAVLDQAPCIEARSPRLRQKVECDPVPLLAPQSPRRSTSWRPERLIQGMPDAFTGARSTWRRAAGARRLRGLHPREAASGALRVDATLMPASLRRRRADIRRPAPIRPSRGFGIPPTGCDQAESPVT